MSPLDQGLFQIYTGDGKGKTTAAVGQAVRACGAGLRVCFVQFIKGGEPSSELAPLQALGIRVIRPALAATGLLRHGVSDEDRRAAREAWQAARETIASGEWDVVVLDELHAAVRHGLVELAAVLETITSRPAHVEIISTGRRAPEPLLAIADLITEMHAEKHPFQAGIAARRGIEF